MPSPSRASSLLVRCAGTRPSRTPPRSSTTCSESLQFLILGGTSLHMLIQARSATQPSAPATQAKASVSPKLSSLPASHEADLASGSFSRRAKRKVQVLPRERIRQMPTTMHSRTRRALPPQYLNPLQRRRSSMLLSPSKRLPNAERQFLSPKRALRVMKGKHVENAVTLPSYETARVSSATRADRRAGVVRVIRLASHPIGGDAKW